MAQVTHHAYDIVNVEKVETGLKVVSIEKTIHLTEKEAEAENAFAIHSFGRRVFLKDAVSVGQALVDGKLPETPSEEPQTTAEPLPNPEPVAATKTEAETPSDEPQTK